MKRMGRHMNTRENSFSRLSLQLIKVCMLAFQLSLTSDEITKNLKLYDIKMEQQLKWPYVERERDGESMCSG